jgi:hypothetical protein
MRSVAALRLKRLCDRDPQRVEINVPERVNFGGYSEASGSGWNKQAF